jgi:hypothetical protein
MVGHIRPNCGQLKFQKLGIRRMLLKRKKMLKNIPRQNMFLHIGDNLLKSLSIFAITVG